MNLHNLVAVCLCVVRRSKFSCTSMRTFTSIHTFVVEVIAYMCRHPAQHVVGRCDDHDGKNSVI
jgi:hypothetical protein